jgi:GNAT superfamily N-acetyltransferase
MTKKEFDHLVASLLPIVDPELVFIAECEGKPAGFSVALPNYNFLLHKIKGKLTPLSLLKFLWYKNKITSVRIITLGVVKEFQGKGIDSLFYYYTWKTGLRKGYHQGEFSWVLENNTMMNKIAQHLGATIHKTYRIYEKGI